MGDVFAALSDPTRRRILELLAQSDKTAGEIADCFPITKASISHHLNVQEMMKWFFTITGEESDHE